MKTRYVRVEVMPSKELERWLRRRGIRVICKSIMERYQDQMVLAAYSPMAIMGMLFERRR